MAVPSFIRCKRAASAVEFALVMPLFLMLVFGIVVYGSYFAVVHGVQQLAAEAARSSIAGLTEAERSNLARSYVSTNAAAYPLIMPSNLAVNAASSASDANVFVVTVNYDASAMLLYTLPAFVPLPPQQIARSAAIPRGGY